MSLGSQTLLTPTCKLRQSCKGQQTELLAWPVYPGHHHAAAKSWQPCLFSLTHLPACLLRIQRCQSCYFFGLSCAMLAGSSTPKLSGSNWPCVQGDVKPEPHVARHNRLKPPAPADCQASTLARHATATQGCALANQRGGQHRQLADSIRRKTAATADYARQQRITQALQKQMLKQMTVCFESWRAEAKQGQVHLRGASSMLQWRKLLRIWKV